MRRVQKRITTQRRKRKPRHSPWIFWTILVVAGIVWAGVVAFIIWLLTTQSLSQLVNIFSILGGIAATVVVIPTVVLAFFQWFFPRSSESPNLPQNLISSPRKRPMLIGMFLTIRILFSLGASNCLRSSTKG